MLYLILLFICTLSASYDSDGGFLCSQDVEMNKVLFGPAGKVLCSGETESETQYSQHTDLFLSNPYFFQSDQGGAELLPPEGGRVNSQPRREKPLVSIRGCGSAKRFSDPEDSEEEAEVARDKPCDDDVSKLCGVDDEWPAEQFWGEREAQLLSEGCPKNDLDFIKLYTAAEC